jgi:predicted RNA binding protein YcfA (HicA-like mRNA interferase family)
VKAISGKELCKLLERHGWELRRIHGSHHIYGREGSVVRLSVPVYANTPLKKGILQHFLKLAGLSEQDIFEAL